MSDELITGKVNKTNIALTPPNLSGIERKMAKNVTLEPPGTRATNPCSKATNGT